MKIQRIKLENFRSYAHFDVELPNRISVIRGGNHVGKSTIEQGIQYALAARSESTNAAGAGADEYLIRKEVDIARVFLDLEIDGKVDKLRATISRKNGRTLATKDAEGVDTTNTINPWLRKHSDVISCLTNSRYFVDLDSAKQKDILSGIVLPERYDGWDTEMITASETVGMESRAYYLNEHPFKVIGSMYDMAFEMRKNVNRDIKNFVAPSSDFTDCGDVAEIKERLAARREELRAEQKKRTAMVADVEATKGKRALVQKRIKDAEDKHRDENRTLTEAQAKTLDKKQHKANTTLAAQGRLAAELDTKVATLEIELKTVKAAAEKADALDGKCGTCEQSITEDVKAIILRPLVERQNAIASELRTVKEQRASIGDFALAKQALEDHAAAEKDVLRATERLQEANAELAAADIDMDALPQAGEVDTTEIDAVIAGLEERITTGTNRLSAVSAANERKIAFEAATEKMAKLKERSALLEKLVAYFGPTGVQATLLQEHVGAFTASMNEVLGAWGYQCALRFDPNFFFGIVTAPFDDQTEWALRTLSKSERYRFAIAFQVALAMHTGFRFVVIDETDMLDTHGRGGLMQKIIASELDQAILLGTDERPSISVGMSQAADFFMVSSELVDGIPTSSVSRIHAAV